ncbi:hypothetical protein CSUI_009508, partial [Cystoisospora suis]
MEVFDERRKKRSFPRVRRKLRIDRKR